MSGKRRRASLQLTARLLLLPILAQSVGGCSLAAVQGPPETVQRNPPPIRCTTSLFLPITDGVVGGMVVIETGFQIAADQMQSGSLLVPFLLVGASAVGLLLYSSGVGMDRVDACREAKAKELRRQQRPPPRLAAPPVPVAAPPPTVRTPPPAPDTDQTPESPTVAPVPAEPRVPQRADPE
jgi:hypothetical protein